MPAAASWATCSAAIAVTHHRIDNPVRIVEGPPAEPARGDAIAYVGRLTREKGADLVADAARAAGLPALFIGAGPLEAELRARPGVAVIGWQAPEAVWEMLRTRARAVAAPSRWYETGPLTVYEALAAGIPVVASDRSGAAEKVRHGQTGFVVAPGDRAAGGSLHGPAGRRLRPHARGRSARSLPRRAHVAGLARGRADVPVCGARRPGLWCDATSAGRHGVLRRQRSARSEGTLTEYIILSRPLWTAG